MLKFLNHLHSSKKSLFPIYVQMLLFPKPTFHFKGNLVVLILFSVVQKLLILIELRERYMTLDQHTLITIWHLVSVNDTEHGVSLSALQSDCLLPLIPESCHGSWSPASCFLLLPSQDNCIHFMCLLSLGSASRTVHPMIWNVPWARMPWNTNLSPSHLE